MKILQLNLVAWTARMENKCEQCSETFTEKRNLTRHNKDVHKGKKLHKCQICQKQFSRKKNKELHQNNCITRINQETPQERTYRIINDLSFNIILRQTAFGGCFADWSIVYPQDYYFIDPAILLAASAKAMKKTLLDHLREHKHFKFSIAIHVNFIKATNPDIQTIPPVCLTTAPYTVWPATDIDEVLETIPNDLTQSILEYENIGSGWVIDHIVRFHTNIASFSCL